MLGFKNHGPEGWDPPICPNIPKPKPKMRCSVTQRHRASLVGSCLLILYWNVFFLHTSLHESLASASQILIASFVKCSTHFCVLTTGHIMISIIKFGHDETLKTW